MTDLASQFNLIDPFTPRVIYNVGDVFLLRGQLNICTAVGPKGEICESQPITTCWGSDANTTQIKQMVPRICTQCGGQVHSRYCEWCGTEYI